MKVLISILFVLGNLSVSAQDYFVKRISFDEGSNDGVRIILHQNRNFALIGHFCENLECTSISELSLIGDTLWTTTIPDIDIGRSSIAIYGDTITVTGNNDPFNTLFRIVHYNLDGEKFGETIEIEHPSEMFSSMFQQNTIRFENKTLVTGRGIQNDTMQGLIYVMNDQNTLDTLIRLEPQDRLSVLWDLELNSKEEFLTFHEIEEDAFDMWYRKINKFDKNFNLIWSYKSEVNNNWSGTATGLEMEDSRVILVTYTPDAHSFNKSIRAINPDKSISWQYNPPFFNEGYETTGNIKQLPNGDLLGMGRYTDMSLEEPIHDSPFLYKMTTEGEIIWKRIFYEIDPQTGNTRRGFVRDAVELDNGDIYGIGEMKYDGTNNVFIFKVDANGCLDADDCGFIQLITATEDLVTNNGISIFPNPTAQDYITISLDQVESFTDYSVRVYNLLGKLITTQSLSNPLTKINLGNEKGVLIFTIIKNGTVIKTEKIVRL